MTAQLVDAGIGIVNPLIYRNIINNGILRGNAALICPVTLSSVASGPMVPIRRILLAILAGILGLLDAGLGFVQPYLQVRASCSPCA